VGGVSEQRTDHTPKKAWQEAFIAALRDSGIVATAARVAGISYSHAYAVRRKDADFAAEWDEAAHAAGVVLEEVLYRRAIDGSDTLGIFLMKNLWPEKYGDKATRVEHSGKIDFASLLSTVPSE
jgi:hypothetical protein